MLAQINAPVEWLPILTRPIPGYSYKLTPLHPSNSIPLATAVYGLQISSEKDLIGEESEMQSLLWSGVGRRIGNEVRLAVPMSLWRAPSGLRSSAELVREAWCRAAPDQSGTIPSAELLESRTRDLIAALQARGVDVAAVGPEDNGDIDVPVERGRGDDQVSMVLFHDPLLGSHMEDLLQINESGFDSDYSDHGGPEVHFEPDELDGDDAEHSLNEEQFEPFSVTDVPKLRPLIAKLMALSEGRSKDKEAQAGWDGMPETMRARYDAKIRRMRELAGLTPGLF